MFVQKSHKFFAQEKSMRKKRNIKPNNIADIEKRERKLYTITANITYLTSNYIANNVTSTKREFSLQKKDVYYYTSFKDGVAIVR